MKAVLEIGTIVAWYLGLLLIGALYLIS